MFKKRLKGLLAMVLAGSMTLTMLPMSASARIDGTISVVGGETVDKDNIETDLNASYHAYLNDNNMWAVNSYSEGSSGYINATVSGDNLAGKLNEYKVSIDTRSSTSIKYSHKYVVTTDDPQTTAISAASSAYATTFPVQVNVSSPDPLASITGYTVWYGVTSNGNVNSNSAVKAGDTTPLSGPTDSISIPMSTFEGLYTANIPNSSNLLRNFVDGVTIIQLQKNYKTFEIPVYDGLGVDTTKKVEITQTDSADPLTYKDETEPLKGKYKLVYKDGDYSYQSDEITTKNGLWSAIGNVATGNGEFDVSNAKLVRYVKYSHYEDSFTSIDLATGITNDGIEYLNAKKSSDNNFLVISLPRKVEVVSGGSFDTRMSELLETEYYNGETIYLTHKGTIYITAVDPESLPTDSAGNYILSDEILDDDYNIVSYNILEYNSDGQYPVNVSDLFSSFNTARNATPPLTNGRLDPGKKFDTNNWEFWPCKTGTGLVTKTKGTVHDKDKITIDYYQGREDYLDVLVYFPKVDIAPTTPTTPTRPSTPSTPSTPSNTGNTQKPKEPVIDPETGKTGWDAIADRIGDAEDGDKIVIDMNSNTELPKNILDSIKGKEIDIVLDMGNGITWTINGKDVKNPQDIDLSVSDNTKIPVKVINKVTGECSYITISLNHNGSFGFKAVLTIELGKKNKGYYANLYYYNPKTKSTELTESDKINSNGEADFSFTHASDYIIIIDTVNHAKPVVKATSTANSARLSWNEVPGAEKYAVYKYRNGKAVKLIETEKRAVKINKLKSDTEYKYIVRAYINGKWTTMTKSDIVTVKTKAE